MIVRIFLSFLLLFSTTLACYLDPSIQCSLDGDCLTGRRCLNNRCACPDTQLECNGACVNTLTARQHCGQCGNACPSSGFCSAGTCVAECSSPKRICGDTCVSPDSDPQHCGSCGQACRLDQACLNAACACPSGQQECNSTCIDLQSSVLHCGKCGTKCKDGGLCVNGTCIDDCKTAPLALCSGQCRNTAEDINHCGGCDKKCPSATNSLCCGGQCRDKLTDAAHCGQCNNPCGAGASCQQGKCTCPPSLDTCANSCVDTQTSTDHCGGCGKPCKAGEVCSLGICCPQKQTACSIATKKRCVDLQTNPSFCGKCDTSCQGQVCQAGLCKPCIQDADCASGLSCSKGLCLCGAACSWLLPLLGTSNQLDEIRILSIATDASQNLYAAGFFKGSFSFEDTKYTSKGGKDILLLRLDSSGKPVWILTFGGKQDDEAVSLALSAQGLAVTGNFADTLPLGTISLQAEGPQDLFILQIDSTGKVLWAKKGGGPGLDRASALAIDTSASPSIFVTGRFAQTATFGNKTVSSSGQGLFVTKLDLQGNFLESLSLGSSMDPRALVADSDTSIYITGSFSDSFTFKGQSLPSTGNSLFALKYGPNLQEAWAFVSQGGARGNALALNRSGKLYLGGYLNGAIKIDTRQIDPIGASNDALLLRIRASDGVIEFSLAFGGADLDEITGLASDPSDFLYISGNFAKSIEIQQTSYTSKEPRDSFLLRFTPSDSFSNVWLFQSPKPTSQKIQDLLTVTTDITGNPYVSGVFNSTLSLEPPSPVFPATTAKGFTDAWLYKLPKP